MWGIDNKQEIETDTGECSIMISTMKEMTTVQGWTRMMEECRELSLERIRAEDSEGATFQL